MGTAVEIAEVGGLHHRYERRAACRVEAVSGEDGAIEFEKGVRGNPMGGRLKRSYSQATLRINAGYRGRLQVPLTTKNPGNSPS
jgi:hypothetical protein